MTREHSPEKTPPPRRPFEDRPPPAPFHRTPEFRRLLVFAGLLVFVALFWLYTTSRVSQSERDGPGSPPAVAKTAQSTAPPTPEEVEARQRRLLTLFEGALADSENGEDFRETQGYRHLIQILAQYTPEEVSNRATQRLDYAAFMRDPNAWRGEFVRVRGIMSGMRTEKLSTSVFDIHDVYRGILVEPDGSEGVAFDMLEPPPPFEMRRQPVDIEGIFYRTVQYANEAGKLKEAPYLLVKSFKVVEHAPVTGTSFLKDHAGLALLCMGLAIFVTRLLMYVFQRRAQHPAARVRTQRTSGFREMFEKKMREHGQSQGPKPPESPPTQ